MTESREREMVKRPPPAEGERSTSLQPTYEDSMPPDEESDWEAEE